MGKVLVTEDYLEDIGDAIREQLEVETTYKPSEMAAAIESISGYPEPTGTKQITANGTGIDVKDYADADVNVPNSYAAGDEGKVVSNGALVAQTSATKTQNGTYDTTLNNEIVVNVSGGGGGSNRRWNYGGFFGTPDGTATGSVSYDFSQYGYFGESHIGDIAVMVVMHRDTITMPSEWTLVDTKIQSDYAESGASTSGQRISIYKKTVASDTETGTITQASNVRMNACLLFFESGAQFQFNKAVISSLVNGYRGYDISVGQQSLIVISNVTMSNSGESYVSNHSANVWSDIPRLIVDVYDNDAIGDLMYRSLGNTSSPNGDNVAFAYNIL